MIGYFVDVHKVMLLAMIYDIADDIMGWRFVLNRHKLFYRFFKIRKWAICKAWEIARKQPDMPIKAKRVIYKEQFERRFYA